MQNPPSVSITVERHQELLEKERAADAALFAAKVVNSTSQSWNRIYSGSEAGPHFFRNGYAQAVKDYAEHVVRFAAANPPVAAVPATTDELPF